MVSPSLTLKDKGFQQLHIFRMHESSVNSQTISIWVKQNTASIVTTKETILNPVIFKKILSYAIFVVFSEK